MAIPNMLTLLAHTLSHQQVIELVARSLLNDELEFAKERLQDKGEDAITDPDDRLATLSLFTDPEYLANVVSDTMSNLSFEAEVQKQISALANEYVNG